MRVLVFGSTGMVGRAVVARLQAFADVELHAVSRRNEQFDAVRAGGVRQLLEGADVAINCVGVLRNDPEYGTVSYLTKATSVNSLWPQRLAIDAAAAGCRVVHVSSDAVFSPGIDPAGEDESISPCESYGLSKALGEVESENVINLRVSVIGPAADRVPPPLWDWLLGQKRGSSVPGYASFGWTGCTSEQLAYLISDVIRDDAAAYVRTCGPVHHFVPNGIATKFSVLALLAERFRPDLSVVPARQDVPLSRPLVSRIGAIEEVYTGPRGWADAVAS